MAAKQYPDAGGLPPVAPIEAGELPAYEPSTTWPRTLGIVSIIFGVLGVAKGLLSIAGMPLIVSKLGETEAYRDFLNSPLVQTWKTTRYVYGGLAILLGVFLLTCGIGLLRRRGWSAKGLSGWAVAKVIVEAALSVLDYAIYVKISQAIRQRLLETEGVPPMFQTWSVSGLIFSLAISCGLALFVLIWLARREIREEIAGWR